MTSYDFRGGDGKLQMQTKRRQSKNLNRAKRHLPPRIMQDCPIGRLFILFYEPGGSHVAGDPQDLALSLPAAQHIALSGLTSVRRLKALVQSELERARLACSSWLGTLHRERQGGWARALCGLD